MTVVSIEGQDGIPQESVNTARLGPLQIIQGAHAMRDVPARARDVYRYLASLVDNRTLGCHPSIAAIADDCDRSRSWVAAGLKELRNAGYIHVDSGALRSATSYYRIDRPKAAALYAEFCTRHETRSRTLGWKSEKAASSRTKSQTSNPVAATYWGALDELPAAAALPASSSGLSQLSDEELQTIARHPSVEDAELRIAAITILSQRFTRSQTDSSGH